MTREEQVRIIRDSVSTSDVDNPITFDPPEWALRAVQHAHKLGGALGYHVTRSAAQPALDDVNALRSALEQMLDQFGEHLDKQVRREFSALLRPEQPR